MNSSPCAKFTTSMMPKISVSPEATSARIMPATMPLTVWIRICCSGIVSRNCPSAPILHSEIAVDDRIVDIELARERVVTDHALLHEIGALARRKRQRHVLLDQQDRHALAMQRRDDLADLRHHARHQAFGRLIEQ